MALKDLTAQEMVAISAAWLDPKQERALLEKYTMLSSLLPIIESAHRGLLRTQLGSNAQEMRSDALALRAQSADQIYDRKARAVYHLLTGFAEYVDGVDGTARILDVRDELFPEGLKVTRKSFMAQAQEASEVKRRLSAETVVQLRELPVPGGATLEKAVDEWIAAGLELGKVELAKAEMKSRQKDGVSISAADVLRARNQWVRAARGLRSMMTFEEVLDSEVGRLLSPLERAESQAERS